MKHSLKVLISHPARNLHVTVSMSRVQTSSFDADWQTEVTWIGTGYIPAARHLRCCDRQNNIWQSENWRLTSVWQSASEEDFWTLDIANVTGEFILGCDIRTFKLLSQPSWWNSSTIWTWFALRAREMNGCPLMRFTCPRQVGRWICSPMVPTYFQSVQTCFKPFSYCNFKQYYIASPKIATDRSVRTTAMRCRAIPSNCQRLPRSARFCLCSKLLSSQQKWGTQGFFSIIIMATSVVGAIATRISTPGASEAGEQTKHGGGGEQCSQTMNLLTPLQHTQDGIYSVLCGIPRYSPIWIT